MNTTKITPKAKKLARWLRRENRSRSWRQIAAAYKDPIVKHGTLQRIATSLRQEGVQWYPKSESILLAIGLITPRKPRTVKRLEDRTPDELIAMRHRLAMKIEQVDALIMKG